MEEQRQTPNNTPQAQPVYRAAPTQKPTKQGFNFALVLFPIIGLLLILGGGYYWHNSIITEHKINFAIIEDKLENSSIIVDELNEENQNLRDTQIEMEEQLVDLKEEIKELKTKPKVIADRDTGIKIVEPGPSDYLRGSPDAKITLIEYSDIDCPYCARFHKTAKEIVESYPDDVNWVYRHFPLTQLHPNAPRKAEAVECVGELAGDDAFWTYLDMLFEEKTPVTELAAEAASVGADEVQFQECLNSGKYASKLTATAKEAADAGGRGTPYSILYDGTNTVPINGALPFEQVKAQIEALLK